MATLTIYLDNKKSEKAIKAILDALGVVYEEQNSANEYPSHVVDGVRIAKKELAGGKVKDYEGFDWTKHELKSNKNKQRLDAAIEKFS